MVLLTKEAFIQVKTLTSIYVNAQNGPAYPGQPPTPVQWQVFVQGFHDSSGNSAAMGGGLDMFQTYINCDCKEDAYRLFNDLMRQVSDSGEVGKLTEKMLDDVLKEEK